MKRIALLATTVLFAGATHAAEIRNSITNSVQLKVDPAISVTSAMPDTYAVSGSNIDVQTLGGLGTAGVYAIDTNGGAFSFSETSSTGGTTSTTQSGGTAGSLAGTITTVGGGAITLTPGGSGTQAIGQTAIELSVFQ